MWNKVRFMSAKEAAAVIPSNKTITVEGFAWGFCFPEEVVQELEKRFMKTGEPRNMTLFFGAGPGDKADRGFNRFGHEGFLKTIIGSHYALNPKLQKLIAEEKVDAYNMPLGVIAQGFRELAAGKSGVLSDVGINTFVDPRFGGGRLNQKANHDVAEVISIREKEYLYYEMPKPDVVLLRGTYSDENGNITLDKEVVPLTGISLAEACHNNGGLVIVQVEKVVKAGSLHPKKVEIPGIFVDIVVEVENPQNHMLNFFNQYDPSFTGEIREAISGKTVEIKDLKKRIIAERAFKELQPGMIVNLGIGIPEYVAAIAKEENCIESLSFTVECGILGGMVQSGTDFACSKNPEALIDMAYMFDFYHGGGLDLTCLGFAEIDKNGNVNVGRIGNMTPGIGGFVDISQNTKTVIFCGTITTSDGKKKLKKQVEQISFNGMHAFEKGQKVLYITEVAVFQMTKDGLELIEVAPDVDIEKEILEKMDFEPIINNVKPMLK